MAALPPPPSPTGLPPAAAQRGRILVALRRLFAPIAEARGATRWLLWAGVLITLIFVVLALFAPLIAPYDFAQYVDDGRRFPKQGGPSEEHPWGTTVLSFDVFSRVVYGSRTALQVMLLAVALSLFAGVVLGLAAGYFGGWLDRVLVLIMDALFAFPYLLLAIVAHYIPGAPPDLVDPPRACRFHPRCPDAMWVCAARHPIQIQTDGDHRVGCWLNGPEDRVPAGGGEPLEREEISVADEA